MFEKMLKEQCSEIKKYIDLKYDRVECKFNEMVTDLSGNGTLIEVYAQILKDEIRQHVTIELASQKELLIKNVFNTALSNKEAEQDACNHVVDENLDRSIFFLVLNKLYCHKFKSISLTPKVDNAFINFILTLQLLCLYRWKRHGIGWYNPRKLSSSFQYWLDGNEWYVPKQR